MSEALALVSDSKLDNLFRLLKEKAERSGCSDDVTLCEMYFLHNSLYMPLKQYKMKNVIVKSDCLLSSRSFSAVYDETKDSIYGALNALLEKLYGEKRDNYVSDSVVIVLKFMSDYALSLIHDIVYLMRCGLESCGVKKLCYWS